MYRDIDSCILLDERIGIADCSLSSKDELETRIGNSEIMKRVILVLNLFITIIIGLSDDVTDEMADLLSMSRTDVEICMNKTNVNVKDLMKMDELIDDDVMTTDINNSALKVGCLFACLLQKKDMMSGVHINVEQIKKMMDIKMRLSFKYIAMRNQILDTCADRVKSKTDECEVTFIFYLCIIAEVKRKETWRIM